MKKILAVNIGSGSEKYSFYNEERLVCFSHYEKEGNNFVVSRKIFHQEKDLPAQKIKLSEEQFKNSHSLEINFLKENKIIENENEISAICFRVVCPGNFFLDSAKMIDDEYLEKLEEGMKSAPLHIERTISKIREFKKILNEVLFVGVSDSSFFKNISESKKYYALPKKLSDKYDIKRFGYHGLAVKSVLRKIEDKKDKRIIICHLGSGCSVIATRGELPISASMGFTPLEGLIMSSRSGDVDFGAVSYLAKKEGLDFDSLNKLLNKESGLLGIAGTNDMREIIRGRDKGDDNSKLAFDMFISSVRKFVGYYCFEMGGVDIIAFSGTMGERSDIVRDAVLEGLDDLGISINIKKNNEITERSDEGFIEDDKGRVKIVVVKIDEMREMMLATMDLI